MQPDPNASSDTPDDHDETYVDRGTTAMRAVYSVLFAIAVSVLETVVLAIVVFQLGYSLVTEKKPSGRVQILAQNIVAYFSQILEYLTHLNPVAPFPFSDFPSISESPER